MMDDRLNKVLENFTAADDKRLLEYKAEMFLNVVCDRLKSIENEMDESTGGDTASMGIIAEFHELAVKILLTAEPMLDVMIKKGGLEDTVSSFTVIISMVKDAKNDAERKLNGVFRQKMN